MQQAFTAAVSYDVVGNDLPLQAGAGSVAIGDASSGECEMELEWLSDTPIDTQTCGTE